MIQKQNLQSELRAERTNRAFEICKQALVYVTREDNFYDKCRTPDFLDTSSDEMNDRSIAANMYTLFEDDVYSDSEHYDSLMSELLELLKGGVDVNAIGGDGISLLTYIDRASDFNTNAHLEREFLFDNYNIVIDKTFLNHMLNANKAYYLHNNYIGCESQKYMLFSYATSQSSQDDSYNDYWLPKDCSDNIGNTISALLKPRHSFLKNK